MYAYIIDILDSLNSVVWGTPTVLMFVVTGVCLSVRLKFFQLFNAKLWIENTIFKMFSGKREYENIENSLSPLQAICTALASSIGTGNIAGVATAISIGGPGAIFWMWVSAFFGMMTSYSENTLGLFYRKQNSNNQWCGGPMIYISEGLRNKKHISALASPLAVFYSIFLIGASIGIGNMVQANSISESLNTSFGFPTIFTGIIISLITFSIISGGLKKIGSFTERAVPFMALFYIASTICILISNIENADYVFTSITENAFCIKSASGGLCGVTLKKCISTGFKRGVFSNEAGLGASTIVNSCSSLKEPCEQGMWGIFGVFTDTIIICTLTAFALLSTTVEAYNIDYAINNLNKSPMYVYITPKEHKNKIKINLMDTAENNIPEIIRINNGFRVKYTDKTTYTNIIKITGVFDDGTLTSIQTEEIDGVSLVSVVFNETFGRLSSIILSVAIVLFSFSTIIGWYFYGAKAIEFLTSSGKTKIYNTVYTASAFIGAVTKLELVWTVSDIFNALMAIPNLIALITLSPLIKSITRNYLKRKSGENINPLASEYKQ